MKIPKDEIGNWTASVGEFTGQEVFEEHVLRRAQTDFEKLRGGSFNLGANRCRAAFRRIPFHMGRRSLGEGMYTLEEVCNEWGTSHADDIGFRIYGMGEQSLAKQVESSVARAAQRPRRSLSASMVGCQARVRHPAVRLEAQNEVFRRALVIHSQSARFSFRYPFILLTNGGGNHLAGKNKHRPE